jgi:dehydrogenase/reductase SDR family protein 7
MKAERCAKLCAVAIVNKLDEVWISLNPVLFFLYVSQYAPTIARA